MKIKNLIPALLAALLISLTSPTILADSPPAAISGTVTGKVQHVGFRAMILKQAIEYNLAGTARNQSNGEVLFTLQGKEKRIGHALDAIRKGTKKSSGVKVATSPATLDPNLKTFTVIGWTSTSRCISKPYDLVFNLRPNDRKVDEEEAKKVYNDILKSTLDPDDLKKIDEKDGCPE
jgi:acylphosphatase